MNKKVKIRLKQLIIIIRFYYYSLYCKIVKLKKYKDLWLISERGNDARDNGFSFYKYMISNHSDLNVKYIIDIKSADAFKIKKEHIIKYGSKEHYLAFINANYLISSHIMGFSPEFRMFGKLDKMGLVKIRGKKIFLQHGIVKDLTPGLFQKNVKLDLFICGAKPEYEYILNNFGYNEKNIKYTGLSRYDYLNNTSKRQILLMPTWRQNLFYCDTKDKFMKTNYYNTYNNLINNEELIKLLKENNFTLVFYPHYEIQQHINLFKSKSELIKIASFDNYDVQNLLIESKLLITDFSSVFFDFAYMRKPAIYYQFDYDEYRKEHYQEGYFDYKNDSFGPVVYEEKKVIEKIENYFHRNFNIEKVYIDKINNFFNYDDLENSRRIFEEISKL